MSRGVAASNGFLSSISSLFNGQKTEDVLSSSGTMRGYPDRKGNVFGSGDRSSATKNTHGSMDDGGAWSLPYNYQSRPYPPSPAGQYPPSRTHTSEFESSASVNMTGQPFQSASTLVPAQGRPSMNLSSNVSFPSTAYPPLKHTWKRIRSWCDNHYNELADTLNWPATEIQLEDLEMTIGYTLPSAVRDSYLCYDGQELESSNTCSDGLFFGLPLLSVDQIAEEWKFWRSVDEDISTGANAEVKGWMGSCPAGWVREEYSCRGWIPLITDRVGNYIGVDLSPNPQGGGSPGQVILFGRDFDTKIVLWRGEGEGGWGRFLQYVAEELEGGELWTLEDNNSSDSNDEEDTIGYESYFSNGGAGASRGGGDRGGDGAIGFKLRGEYKGWPVLEAWADRSMRCWDEVGQPASQAPWQKDTPSVLVDEDEAHPEQISTEGESSRSAPQIVTPEGESHPLDPSSAVVPSTSQQSTATSMHTPPSSTLSPPLPSSKAERVKQRRREEGQWQSKEGHTSPVAAQAQPRRPPPAPAAPLDLPTIDDVRAAHAAAMASQGKSGTYHYDVERARPPAGMGGMGMGMGMASTAGRSGYTPRYAVRHSSGQRDVHLNVTSREDDGLELETRSSVDAMSSGRRGSAQSANDERLIDHNRSSPLYSPRVSLSGGQASGGSNGRTLYSPSRSGDGLIDAMSTTDLNLGASAKVRSAIGDSLNPNEPMISSPLATQTPVMSSMQDTSGADNRVALPAIASS